MFDVVYEDDLIALGIEWRNNEPFFHHHIKQWNAKANRKMMDEMKKLTELLKQNNISTLWSYYVLPADNEPYLKKFAKKYNFVFVDQIENVMLFEKEI
jgi:hypothetical protein